MWDWYRYGNAWALMLFWVGRIVQRHLLRAVQLLQKVSFLSAFGAPALICASSRLEELDVTWRIHLSGWNKAHFCCDVFSVCYFHLLILVFLLSTLYLKITMCFCYSTFHNLRFFPKCVESKGHVFSWSYNPMQELFKI